MITDLWLTEVAKSIAGDSYVYPVYLAFGSDNITESEAHTTLTGEIGARVVLSDSRASSVVTYEGTRTGAVETSSGHIIAAVGLLSASVLGTLLSEHAFASVLHTTAFDLQVTVTTTVTRA